MPRIWLQPKILRIEGDLTAMEISSITVERFKRIQKIDVDLKNITLLVGGNNSGKSSLLQGIHFSITTIQSTRMIGTATLAPDQIIFKPTNDPMLLHHGGPMTQRSGLKFEFTYKNETSIEPSTFQMGVKRGKNANISVDMEWGNEFSIRAGDRTRPISIFVPGLAGVALREELRTDAIINTGIAQGDSNLYLRNVLLRIIRNPEKLDRFHSIISKIFGGMTISADYDEGRHHYINIQVNVSGNNLPLEMVGTGCLQAIQIVAYTTMYNPAILLLDEPDSHLHPSNQRLLAETLVEISVTTGTKIVISTHSRHIFDSLSNNEVCEVVWLKDGEKQPIDNVSDLSILLDLGALDSFERLTSPTNKAIVLTEDTKSNKLRFLLELNGFRQGEYYIQPLHGVENISSAYPVADYFSKLGPDTHVLIHRDGDALLDNEKDWLSHRVTAQLPPRTTFFITPLTDIEHQFCQPAHIASVFSISLEKATSIVDQAIENASSKLAAMFSSKRQNAKERILRQMGNDLPGAQDLLSAKMPFEFSKGKFLFGQIFQVLTDEGHNANRLALTPSQSLEIGVLAKFAREAWRTAVPPTHP